MPLLQLTFSVALTRMQRLTALEIELWIHGHGK